MLACLHSQSKHLTVVAGKVVTTRPLTADFAYRLQNTEPFLEAFLGSHDISTIRNIASVRSLTLLTHSLTYLLEAILPTHLL